MGRHPFTEAGLKMRLTRLKKAKAAALKEVTKIHVKVQRGNKKTGPNCYTVSLLPVIDCCNCKQCMHNCYDLKSDMQNQGCMKNRAINSAIHQKDIERFWREVDEYIKENYIEQLRINVGGDLNDDDFAYVAKLGEQNKKTRILFFTKNYKGINKFLDEQEFPPNVHPIMSAWEGLKMQNPHNLPESHVLYEDGKTTAPTFGAYYCGGNCTECSFYDKGCWALKKGEHVIFRVH